MFLSETLQEKWQPVLEHSDLPEIKDAYRRAVTTVILENQEKALKKTLHFLVKLHLLTQQVQLLRIGIQF